MHRHTNLSASLLLLFALERCRSFLGPPQLFPAEALLFFGNTAQIRLRILADLFRQKCVCKTLKYTKYVCGFTPFSDEKSLARFSWRFVWYCLYFFVIKRYNVWTKYRLSDESAALAASLGGIYMFDLLRRIRLNFMVTAILTIVLGVMLIAAPGTAIRTIFLLVGWMLIISGAASLLTSLLSKGQPVGQGDLVLGLVQLATGLVVLMRPSFLISLTGVVVGFVLLIHGIHDIQHARESKALGYEWKLSMGIGVVAIVMGVVVMLSPFSAAETMLRLAGIFLLVDGIGDLMMVIRAGR